MFSWEPNILFLFSLLSLFLRLGLELYANKLFLEFYANKYIIPIFPVFEEVYLVGTNWEVGPDIQDY